MNIAREIAKQYPEVPLKDLSIDTACLKLVHDPNLFRNTVLVMPNLYGDIMSDLASGLVGGLGLTPSGNIGQEGALFESVHGTAPMIAGKNLANPTALLLSSCLMLDHMGLETYGEGIRNAVFKTLANPVTRTKDLGGNYTTSEYTKALIDNF